MTTPAPTPQNPRFIRPDDLPAYAGLLRLAETEIESVIEGPSMGATLPPGTRIRIRGLSTGGPGLGEIAVFVAGGRLVAHRVIHRGRRSPRSRNFVLTRGDANVGMDPPVPLAAILGVVAARQVGEQWEPPPGPWQRPTGRLLRRLLTAVEIGTFEIDPRLPRWIGAVPSLLFRRRTATLVYLLTYVWLGLVAGLANSALIVGRSVLGHHQGVGLDSAWIAPLATAALMLPPGILLAWIAGRFESEQGWRITLVAASSLAALQALLLVQGVHRYTLLLLACGVGVQASVALGRRIDRFTRSMRRTLLPLIGLPLLAGAGRLGAGAIQERLALAGLGKPPSNSPNILLIVLDTVREKSLSLYGLRRPTTPNLAAWARSGVVFRRAYAPAAWTVPSHASILTGHPASGAWPGWEKPIDPAVPTLAERFSARGYATAAFVGNFQLISAETGLARGFQRFEGHPLTWAEALASTALGLRVVESPLGVDWFRCRLASRKTAAGINTNFLEWLGRRPRRPFFVFINYFDAHDPYLPPPPFDTAFGPTRREHLALNQRAPGEPVDELDRQLNAYEGSIAGLDAELGALLGTLERGGLLDSTLVVVTSDHGEQFGEHGLIGHGNSAYRAVMQVPLVISYPGRVPAEVSVGAPVSLRDLAATILDLTGNPSGPGLGSSLSRWWRDPTRAQAAATPVLGEVASMPGIPFRRPDAQEARVTAIGQNWQYIRNGDGSEELYDLRGNLDGGANLAGRSELADTLRAYREATRTPG